jgi:hypothetical protein
MCLGGLAPPCRNKLFIFTYRLSQRKKAAP